MQEAELFRGDRYKTIGMDVAVVRLAEAQSCAEVGRLLPVEDFGAEGVRSGSGRFFARYSAGVLATRTGSV